MKISPVGPSSQIRSARSTTARRQIVRTTARSWLTNTTVVANVVASPAMSSRMVAWTETSSASRK
jgi:hypothetical protein